MLQITSTNEEKVPVSITPLTAAGNPAAVENVSWVVTEGDATVVVIDSTNVEIVSGSGGLSKISVSADADLGEGVVLISDEIEYFVTAAQASTLGFAAGAPVLK
jgi:anti-anti-sigma regulatory factor